MTHTFNKSDGPLVTIIVPTRNSACYLQACLKSIKDQDYPNIELIVVDRNSTDSTVSIAKSYGATILNAGPERSAQLNAGAKVAQGQYIFRVDSDFRLEQSIVSECVSLAIAGADAIVVHNTAIEIGWLSKIRKFEVDMYKYSLDHSTARFISAAALRSIGGYAENMTAGEDYDFQNKITSHGYTTAFCHAEATHLDEPIHLSPVIRKYFIYGRDFSHYLSSNRDPSRIQLAFIRKDFIDHKRNLLEHPLLTIGLVFYHSLKYISGGAGYISAIIWPPRGGH